MVEFKKISRLKLHSTILSKQYFAGNFRSLFKGNGLNFKEIREYVVEDDIKSIDWKTSAKYAKPFIKINEEERFQQIFFVIDVSKSIEFGTSYITKKDLIAEICFLIAYSSAKNNDKIGAIFFSEEIEKVIPLSKNQNAVSIIAKELLELNPQNTGTSYKNILNYINKNIKKNTIIFILSDFISDIDYEKELSILSKKFTPIFIQINDNFEQNIPKTNLIKVFDSETQTTKYIEIEYNQKLQAQINQKQLFFEKKLKQYRIRHLNIELRENYIKKLKTFFNNYK